MNRNKLSGWLLALLGLPGMLAAQPCPGTTPAIVINEIHYNPPASPDPGDWVELHNPTLGPVSLGGWSLQDEGGTYTIPAATVIPAGGYLVIVQNTASFATVYGPGVNNYIGPMPFGLSGSGERIQLLSDAGCKVDSLRYDDKFPWPPAADGSGPSLELINPNLDNSLYLSWVASPLTNGTPGSANAGGFDPCVPTPETLVITEINYASPHILDAGDWVEIYNPNPFAVDLSTWRLSDGTGTQILPLGTQIGPGDYFVFVADTHKFTYFHSSLPATKYAGNFSFGLSRQGDQLVLASATGCVVDGVIYDTNGDWPAAPAGNGSTLALRNPQWDNTLVSSWGAEANVGGSPGTANTIREFPCQPAPDSLVINEIQYHPHTLDAPSGDWVEIYNPQTVAVDISYWQIQSKSGVQLFFPGGTVIPAQGYFVLVEDSVRFSAQYPSVSNFVGNFDSLESFSRSGDRLRLYSATYCLVDEVEYDNLPPWPSAANGLGYTLSLKDTASENRFPTQWGASASLGGTPGTANTLTPDCSAPAISLVINELNYNSHPAFDPGDWIELYNPNPFPVTPADWVMMDKTGGFSLPAGLVIPAGGYWVLVEDSAMFSARYPAVSNFVGNLGYTLRGEGEAVLLLDPAFCLVDQLTYNDLSPWPHGPAGHGPTLSLVNPSLDNSLPGSWLPSAATGGTPGVANVVDDPCDPGISPILIHEINYNSPSDFDPGNWIELYNPNPVAVNLAGWEFLTDSAVYVFPTGTSIAAGGYLLLTENPFLFSFQFPGIANVLGPIGFGLDNAGEKLRLYSSTYCLVDSVRFNDKTPWPELGDGGGPSIALRDPALDNALGENWIASPGNGTPGRGNVPTFCAPGRVDEGLLLWLRADAGTSDTTDGQPVHTWSDQSGNAGDFTQLSSAAQPLYKTQAPGFNGNPALYFDDLDDGMISGLAIENPYTLFVVYSLATFPQEEARAVEGDNGWLIGPYRQNHSLYAGAWVADGTPINDGDTRAAVAVALGSGFIVQMYVNGTNVTNGFGSGEPGLLSLGASGPAADPLGGYIAEVIVYNRKLSPGERQSVSTYLATRYGIALPTAEHRYYGDEDYAQQIAGIGKDTVACWAQLQSQSNDPAARLTISGDQLQQESFLYWGHDGASLGETTDTTEIPVGVVAKIRRIWRIETYGIPGPVDLRFDLAGLNYSLDKLNEFVLLRDGGNNFNNSVVLADQYRLDGSALVFSGLTLSDGDHLSLARREVIALDLHVKLQGAYNSATGLMRDSLRRLVDFPLTEPYTALGGFTRIGDGGAETLTAATLALTGGKAIVDWIWVELRDKNDPQQVRAARPALVRTDGQVVDTDGVSPLSFPGLSADLYYIAVRHRNHLGAMTASAHGLSASPATVDFDTVPLYGNDPVAILPGGKKGLWAGDVNQDGKVAYQGIGNDLTSLFVTVLTAPGNSSFSRNYLVSGYQAGDVNLDGRTVFQGLGSDTSPIFLNVLSHPGNSGFNRNHLILSQLP